MADALSIIVRTQLELDRKAQIQKLNNELAIDKDARVKVIAGLDIPESTRLIKADLETISKNARFTINNITFGAINTGQLQNNLNQATANTKATVAITPTIDTQGIKQSVDKIKYQYQKSGLVESINNAISGFAKGDSSNQILAEITRQFHTLDSTLKITSTEFLDSQKNLQSLLVSVQSATGAVEKFQIAWKDGTDSEEETGKYQIENIKAADAGIQKLIETTQIWNNKTKAVRTDMMATLKQIRTSWLDTNGGKSVEDSDNLQRLSAKYVEIVNKIKSLREANTTTFSSLKSDVTTAIKELNGMVKSFHNAEKVATSLRTKGTEVVKQDTLNNIDKFENQIRNSKVPIEIFTNEIQRLRDVMVSLNDSNVTKAGVASGLTSVLDGLDNAKTKFQSLRELLRSFNSAGSTDWLKTYKDQINSIADITIKGDGDRQIKVFDALNTKVSIYKKALTEIQQSWNPENNVQGIDAISVAFGRLIKEANLVQKNAQKNPQAFDNWVTKIEQTISGVDKLKKHLDEEVGIQRRIYDLQGQIAKLSLNPDKNSSMLIYKQEELSLAQEELRRIQKKDNLLAGLISVEEQRKYVIQQTTNEAKKLEEIQISISDKQAQIQAKAAEYSAKLNTRIVDEKQVEILNQLTNIERNRANIAKTTDEQLKANYGNQISLSEKVIAKIQEELRAEGQLSTEFQNQINLRRQEIAEADRQRQNTAYQKQETAYLNEISELYKQISSGLKKISAEKSEANKQSIRDNELTNARRRISEIQQEVEGNERLSQAVAERIRYEKEQLAIQQQRITNSNAVKQAEQQAKEQAQQAKAEAQQEKSYLTEISQLYKTIAQGIKQMASEKNEANKLDIQAMTVTKSYDRIAKIEEEAKANQQLSQIIKDKIAQEEADLAVKQRMMFRTVNDNVEANRIKQEQQDYKVLTQLVKEYVSEIQKQLDIVNKYTQKSITTKSTDNIALYRQEIENAEKIIQERLAELESNGLLTESITKLIEVKRHKIDIDAQEAQNNIYANEQAKREAENVRRQQEAAKAYEQQAKAIQTYTKQIQDDINQLNRMSVNTIFSTNANNTQVQAQKTAIQDLTKEYEKLKATLNGNISATDLDKVKTRLAELRVQLDNAKVGMNNLKTSMQSDKSAQKLAGDIAILTAQIKQFRASNSRSEGKFGAEYDALLQKLKQNPDVSGLYAIRQQFRQLQGDVRAAGLTGTTFFDKLKADAMKFSAWFGVAAPGMLIAREIRQMFSSVVELDTAIVDLKKTFKGSTQELQEFYYSANDVARQLGVTTQAVIQSSADWSRLGYDTAESARNMAEAASIFSVISPGVDVSSATDGLVAVLQGFKELDDSNVIDDVLSKINIIGNNMPVSNADILEFLKRSSAAMSEAGNSLENVIAMGTAITSVTRDAAGAGTALKTNDCLYVQKCA